MSVEPEADAEGGAGDRLQRLAHVETTASEVAFLSRALSLDGDGWGQGSYPRKPDSVWAFNGMERKRSTLQQRFLMAFEKKLGCETKFLLGPYKVPVRAHKVVVGSASNVFAELIFGTEETEFPLPDCTVAAFNELLGYIYKRPETVSIPVDTAADYLKVANKFAVPGFLEACLDSLVSSISSETVFEILNLASAFNIGDALLLPCWEYIETRTMDVLEVHQKVLHIDFLIQILQNNHLRVSEVELFKGVFGWCKAECLRLNLKPVQENLRKLALQLLPWIRFPTLPSPDFKSSLLSVFYTALEIKGNPDLNKLNLENVPEKYSKPPINGHSGPRVPRLYSRPNEAVKGRDRVVTVEELIRALLPPERRESFTEDKIAQLVHLLEVFKSSASYDLRQLTERAKELMAEIQFF